MPLFQTLERHPELLNHPGAVARQVEIPPTDRQHYITGIYALNVHPPEDTSGDWHDVFHWREGLDRPGKIWIAGRDSFPDTNPIYGDMGIYDGTDQIRLKNLDIDSSIKEIWIANHFRAILDMLYRSLKLTSEVHGLRGATEDWVDTPEQKDFVLSQAALLNDWLDDTQKVALAEWIDYERREREF